MRSVSGEKRRTLHVGFGDLEVFHLAGNRTAPAAACYIQDLSFGLRSGFPAAVCPPQPTCCEVAKRGVSRSIGTNHALIANNILVVPRLNISLSSLLSLSSLSVCFEFFRRVTWFTYLYIEIPAGNWGFQEPGKLWMFTLTLRRFRQKECVHSMCDAEEPAGPCLMLGRSNGMM